MKAELFNAHNKYMILKHALKENNISQTCMLFGISRTTFYKWHKAYQKHGMIGLETKEPQKPRMPNKVGKAIENEILSYVQKYPADGPKRIFYELKAEGIKVGETGIYNVLKRNNLTTKASRIEFAKKHARRHSIKFSKPTKTVQTTEKSLETLSGNSPDAYPGYLVVQRIDYMGRFEGIGKIYQYSIYDTFSKWGFVKLYNKKQDIDVWDYFEVKLVYLMKTFNLNIEHLLTVKSKEFVPYFVNSEKYVEMIEKFGIHHEFILPEKNPLVEEMGEFNEFLIKAFYQNLGKNSNLDSFLNAERTIIKRVREYNFNSVITKGANAGKRPADVVLERAVQNNVDLDTLPLWLMALINSPQPEREGTDE